MPGMVTLHQVLGFGLVALVLIAIPGPSVVFTVGRAITYGRAVALTTVVGNSLGLLAVLVLVSLGLGGLVATSDTAFLTLKLAGAAYLVWLGVQALRHRHGVEVNALEGPAGRARAPRAPAGLRGRLHQPQGLHHLRSGAPGVRRP
jgi:threonine/homoserine/homoserine lactone efflux protein